MEFNVLFWNINDKKTFSIKRAIESICVHEKINLLILAECHIEPFILNNYTEIKDNLGNLNRRVRAFIQIDPKFEILSTHIELGKKLFFIKLQIDKKSDFTICGVHLLSKFGISDCTQEDLLDEIPGKIIDYEIRNSSKLILIGDFNLHPFEKFMVGPKNLNAHPSRMLSENLKKRKLGTKDYSIFYNPSWNLLGDYNYISKKVKPAGTYFWVPSNVEDFYWNMLDQVIMRESMIPAFKIENLRIIEDFEIGNRKINLMKKHIVTNYDNLKFQNFSDHLPLTFSLDNSKIK